MFMIDTHMHIYIYIYKCISKSVYVYTIYVPTKNTENKNIGNYHT